MELCVWPMTLVVSEPVDVDFAVGFGGVDVDFAGSFGGVDADFVVGSEAIDEGCAVSCSEVVYVNLTGMWGDMEPVGSLLSP